MSSTPPAMFPPTENKHRWWKTLSPRSLNVLIQIFSLTAIFFEGYDQGVMGGVNPSPDYIRTVGIEGDRTKEGGIVAVYYFGALFGCFIGGMLADKIGRIRGTIFASLWIILGGALQAGAQNMNMMLCARVITGLGTGTLTSVVPVYVGETAEAHSRGATICYVFIANYLGIAVSYWIGFGTSFHENGESSFRWRLPLALQCVPALIIACFMHICPDSPRWLAQVGRHEEAYEVLVHLRGPGPETEEEWADICDAAAAVREGTPNVFQILGGFTNEVHLGRRAWLAVWLQVMAQWTGVVAITVYSPTLYTVAGYTDVKQRWLSALTNTVGILGTILCAQYVDVAGRKNVVMFGSAALLTVNFIAGGLGIGLIENPDQASQYGAATASMLFIFTVAYAMTWGSVAFIVPTEIFPTKLRVQGNGFGIAGWALGVGSATLLVPIMFDSLGSKGFFIFGALNVVWIPIVYVFYPETARRPLESINVLFSPSSPFSWDAEREYRRQQTSHIGEKARRDSTSSGPALPAGAKGEKRFAVEEEHVEQHA